MILVFYKS